MNRKEYMRKYQAEWKLKNKEYVLEQARKRYHNKSKEQKSKEVFKNKEYRRKVRLEALEHYGGKCSCCGERNKEFLCFDHINNDGAKHRKNMPDRSIAPWLRRHNYPEGFRVLCHNCNMARGIYGYCPHEKKEAM